MSKLNEILGVEDGKYFTVENSERRFKLRNNKIYEYTSFEWSKISSDIDTLIWLIENAEKIKILSLRPKLNKQQITAIKGRIAEGWKYIAQDADGEIRFFELKPEYDESCDCFRSNGDCDFVTLPIYDFLKPKYCLYLSDLIKEEEEK